MALHLTHLYVKDGSRAVVRMNWDTRAIAIPDSGAQAFKGIKGAVEDPFQSFWLIRAHSHAVLKLHLQTQFRTINLEGPENKSWLYYVGILKLSFSNSRNKAICDYGFSNYIRRCPLSAKQCLVHISYLVATQ